jgi:hypothetical protein
MAGETFTQMGGNKTAEDGGITAMYMSNTTEQPVIATTSEQYSSSARSKFGLSKAAVSGEIAKSTAVSPVTKTSGNIYSYCGGKVTKEATKIAGNQEILVAEGDVEYKSCVIVNQLPPTVSRQGGCVAVTTGSKETAIPTIDIMSDKIQVVSKKKILGAAPEFVSPYAKFIGATVEFTLQKRKTTTETTVRGVQGFSLVTQEITSDRETALQPIFMVNELTITATDGDAIVISPIIIGDMEKGAFILQAPKGEATLGAAKLNQKEAITTTNLGFGCTFLTAIQAAMRGEFDKAARDIIEEIPLLSALKELSEARDYRSAIGPGFQLANCGLQIQKEGLKNHLLKSLGFDEKGNWSIANLKYQIRFGKEQQYYKWNEVVAGSIQTANILLQGARNVNIFSQAIKCNHFLAKGKNVNLEGLGQQEESHGSSSGVSLGLQGGMPSLGVDASRSQSEAIKYIPTAINSKTAVIIAEEEVKFRQAYLETSAAFIEATSLLIETLQDKIKSTTERFSASIALNGAGTLTIGHSKQDKATANNLAGINASDTLYVHTTAGIHNIGGLLQCQANAIPLAVKTPTGLQMFYQYHMPADNDCAFHCLGIARAIAAKQLLNASDNKTIRGLIAAEIVEEIILGAKDLSNDVLPKSLQPEKVAALRTELLSAESALKRSSIRIQKTHGVKVLMSPEEAFETLTGLLRVDEFDELEAALSRVEVAKEAIEDFAGEMQTYKEYITYYVGSPGSWIGFHPTIDVKITGVIDAIAVLNNLHVKIYQKVATQIQLVYECNPTGSKEINMYFTHCPGETALNHFDLLNLSPELIIAPQLTYESLTSYDNGYKFNLGLHDVAAVGMAMAVANASKPEFNVATSTIPTTTTTTTTAAEAVTTTTTVKPKIIAMTTTTMATAHETTRTTTKSKANTTTTTTAVEAITTNSKIAIKDAKGAAKVKVKSAAKDPITKQKPKNTTIIDNASAKNQRTSITTNDSTAPAMYASGKPPTTSSHRAAPKLKQLSSQQSPQEYTPLQWLRLAKRAFMGDHCSEVLTWQQHNRRGNPNAAAFTDHVAQNAHPVEVAKATATGIKDGAVVAGTFVGEEAGRIRLGHPTITGQAFKTTGTLIGEEAARLRLGQPTTTGNFVSFLGEEAARLRLGEQTYMGPVIRQHLQTFADTPTTKLMHDFASSTTQSMLLWEFGASGARAVIKAAPSVARFTTTTAKNAAKATGEFVASHEFQSPITFQFNSSKLYTGIPVDTVKVRNPVKGPKARVQTRKIECSNGLIYEDSSKHGRIDVGKASRAPTAPKTALESSIEANAVSKRRVCYDSNTDEIVVFRYTGGVTFHGHVSTWEKLNPDMRSILIKEFNFTPKGKPPKNTR